MVVPYHQQVRMFLKTSQNKVPNYLFRIVNCYTIEGFCNSNGKMIHSMFIFKFIEVANHFLTLLANSTHIFSELVCTLQNTFFPLS